MVVHQLHWSPLETGSRHLRRGIDHRCFRDRSCIRGCYPKAERGEGPEIVPPPGRGAGLPASSVLAVEFEFLLSGYLDHYLTQDVGIRRQSPPSASRSVSRLWSSAVSPLQSLPILPTTHPANGFTCIFMARPTQLYASNAQIGSSASKRSTPSSRGPPSGQRPSSRSRDRNASHSWAMSAVSANFAPVSSSTLWTR